MPPVLTFSLQSGSNGNAIYVESKGVRLLFDAGISGTQAQQRMASHGRDIREVDGLIISHEHVDHLRCAGIYHRKFGIPLYITRRTLAAARRCPLGPLDDVRHFASGHSLCFGPVTVHTIRTAHDAVDGVAFVVDDGERRLGILTDLGQPTLWMQEVLESVHAAYLESNYDPHMLQVGPYPPHLKARVSGGHGHLSNEQAALMVKACRRHRPSWIAVAHLSMENNRPELAIAAQQHAIGRDYRVVHASRHECSAVMAV